MPPAMPAITRSRTPTETLAITVEGLRPNSFSLSIYGDPSAEIDDLLPSVRDHGILVPLVVASPGPTAGTWEVLSGHRRLACARALGLAEVPCQVRRVPRGAARQAAILEYNRQRRKTFSQLMREADALEDLWAPDAGARRLANLRRGPAGKSQWEESDWDAGTERRDSDTRETPDGPGDLPSPDSSPAAARPGRTDAAIARHLGMGGKDIYRQARAIWRMARADDARASSARPAARRRYQDSPRRLQGSSPPRPLRLRLPTDALRCLGVPPRPRLRHPPPRFDPAGDGRPHAPLLHRPGSLVVNPMAGGGTTLDVCQSMGRRCLAYDLHPTRPEIRPHDVRLGFPARSPRLRPHFLRPALSHHAGPPVCPRCRLVRPSHRLDGVPRRPGPRRLHHPPARRLPGPPTGRPVREGPPRRLRLSRPRLPRIRRRPTRRLLPRAPDQLPHGQHYLPQDVRRARVEGRLLGQVRDLLILRKPSRTQDTPADPSTPTLDSHPFDLASAGKPVV